MEEVDFESVDYNYYRTYDPSTGRYLESDPIGLAGGLGTYTYAFNAPTVLVDRFGLAPGDPFNSLEDALLDAALHSRSHPQQLIEYGGWVYQDGKCFTYNETTSNLPGSVRSEDLEGIKPADPLATWHTHPIRSGPRGVLGDTDNTLSGEPGGGTGDIGVAEYYGIPIYLFTPLGPIIGYDPKSGAIPPLPMREPQECDCSEE